MSLRRTLVPELRPALEILVIGLLAAQSVQAIGASFIKSFFAVFVVSPLVLTVAGAAAFVTGRYVKNPTP